MNPTVTTSVGRETGQPSSATALVPVDTPHGLRELVVPIRIVGPSRTRTTLIRGVAIVDELVPVLVEGEAEPREIHVSRIGHPADDARPEATDGRPSVNPNRARRGK